MICCIFFINWFDCFYNVVCKMLGGVIEVVKWLIDCCGKFMYFEMLCVKFNGIEGELVIIEIVELLIEWM